MIERSGGQWHIYCSVCGDEGEPWSTSDTTFAEAWEEWKGGGWRAYREFPDGDWEHDCPFCQD